MKILILGGLSFLGRHMVEQGLARGHEMTTFTRGKTNMDAYPEVEKLTGDRDGNLSALEGRTWDRVIDTSGYVPRVVRASAHLLADKTEHYTFISTISVYAGFTTPEQDENAPLATLQDPTVEEVTGETYGGLKVLCEQAVEEELPGRTLIIRPGLIVGMYDPTDRYTYWPYRISQGGEVLAPEGPDQPTQIIDGKDLAAFTIRMAEEKKTGAYNATGPEKPLTMGEMLEECKRVSGSDATFTWAPTAFLAEHEVMPWLHMPAWAPTSGEMGALLQTDVSKAVGDGLTFRPLADTTRDTLEWARSYPADHEWHAGLPREREREVLEAWHAASTTTA